MALLKLPYPRTNSVTYEEPTYFELKVKLAELHLKAYRTPDRYRYVYVDAEFHLGEDLPYTCSLPAGWSIDDRKLSRWIDSEGDYPATAAAWHDTLIEITEDEDFLFSSDAINEDHNPYLHFPWELRVLTEPEPYNDGTRNITYETTTRLRRGGTARQIGFQRLMNDWTACPYGDSHNALSGYGKIKRNLARHIAISLFPKTLKPVPEAPAVRTRALSLFEDAKHEPVRMDPSLFPPIDGHYHLSLPPMLTLGLRADYSGYRVFGEPAFMRDNEAFAGFARSPGALPVDRVMVYQSPRAFHLLYVLVAHSRGYQQRFSLIKTLAYAIAIVVPVEQAHPEPVLLRGLPLSINEELAKARGLTNALKRGLNALHGELLKIKRLGLNPDNLSTEAVNSHKPYHHCIAGYNNFDGLTQPAYYVPLNSIPSVVSLIEAIAGQIGWRDDLLGAAGTKPWGAPLLQPDQDSVSHEAPVQRVATGRMLDL